LSRRAYLDWLRGVAVVIMIEAHTLDSWTRPADRDRVEYTWAIILGGFGAPTFLFLAGIALALAAGSRLRKGLSAAEVTALAYRRGWQIFGLALLFRLQSSILGGGGIRSLLRVDILNVMGLAMLAAAALSALGSRTASRAGLLAAAAVAVAMLTPIVRVMPVFQWLPPPLAAYFIPVSGWNTFTIFPWAAFLLAGAALGLWLDSSRTERDERRVLIGLAAIGVVTAVAGYGSSMLPMIYESSSFWTSSPTFLFLRLGILITAVPAAYLWTTFVKGWSPLQELGIASLFVYWIHVELAYGIPSMAIRQRLSLEWALVGFAAFTVFLYGLVKVKDRVMARRRTSADRRTV
jgi:uncharacterized membrane protein